MKALLLLLALSLPLVAQTSYFVSASSGNDSWSGTLSAPNAANTDGPFQTLTKAQAVMQGSGTKTVTVRAGTYTLSSNLAFTSADNGESWLFYSTENPVIDGNSGNYHLTFYNVNGFTMEGFTLQHMAADSMNIQFGNNLTLKWNTFLNCSGFCINGQGQVLNSTVDSNIVNGQSPGNVGAGNGAFYSSFDFGYGSSNDHVTHNLFQNMQGGAIGFGTGPTDPSIHDNLIDRNLIQNSMTNASDGGAIYMYDPSHAGTGNQITNNVVQGSSGSQTPTVGIYLDAVRSHVSVSGNVLTNCGTYCLQYGGGDYNTFTNNILDLSSGAQLAIYTGEPPSYIDTLMNGNTFTHNIVYSSGSFPSSLWYVILNPDDALPTVNTNLYYSANGSSIPNTGAVDSSPTYANPQFTNAAGFDYSMPGGSPAYSALSWTTLATDQGPVAGGPTGAGPTGGGTGGGGVPTGGGGGTGGGGSTGGGGGGVIVPSGGSLAGSGTSATTTANLTTEGSADWIHWGATSLTRKASVTALLSTYAVVGSGSVTTYTTDSRTLSWTDGTPTASASDTKGIYLSSVPNGFSFTAPADKTSRTLIVHVGGNASGGTFTAHLSDGSAADYVDITSTSGAAYDRNYTLIYSAAATGQTLSISWINTTGTGYVSLSGAALSLTGAAPVTLTPTDGTRWYQIADQDRLGDGTLVQMSTGVGALNGWPAIYSSTKNVEGRQPRGASGIMQDADSIGAFTPGDLVNFNGRGETHDSGIPSGSLLTGSGRGSLYGQIPQGVVNGTNTKFKLDYIPLSPYMWLMLNGLEKEPPIDGIRGTNSGGEYTVTGSTLTYNVAPLAGYRHYIKYFIDQPAPPPPTVTGAVLTLVSEHHAAGGTGNFGAGASFQPVATIAPVPSWFHSTSPWTKRTDTATITGTNLTNLLANDGSFYLLLMLENDGSATGSLSPAEELWVYDCYVTLTYSDSSTSIIRPSANALNVGGGSVTNPAFAYDTDATTYAVIHSTGFGGGGLDGVFLNLNTFQ